MITNFKIKKNKSKKRYAKYKTLTKNLKSFDTIVFIATTSNSITLSQIGLIAIPISTAPSCGLSIVSKVIYEIIINKYKKYQKQYEKDQQTIENFDKIYKKSLQDKVINKTESESLCNIFTKFLDETKNESFL